MNSLISREHYNEAFKRLIKKTLIISIVIHLVFVGVGIFKYKPKPKRKFFQTTKLTLVGKFKPRKKDSKKVVAAEKKKPVKKKKPPKKKPNKSKKTKKKKKVKKNKKKKPPKKVNKKAKRIGRGKPKKVKPKEDKSLDNALAMIRKEVQADDDYKKTLEKIKKKVVKERPEPAVKKTRRKATGDVAMSSLTRDMLKIKNKEYYGVIEKKIKDAWVIPSDIAKEKKKGVETVVYIWLEKNGKLSKVEVTKKSGYDHYDDSAVRAIRKAQPFPKLPKSMSRDILRIPIIFEPTD